MPELRHFSCPWGARGDGTSGPSSASVPHSRDGNTPDTTWDMEQEKLSTHKGMKTARTAAALALAAAVVTGGSPAFAAVPAAAERTTGSTTDSWRETAVGYADTHWNWTVWKSATPAATDGDYQPDFQCAEFVARAVAKAGLVPGLAADDPQDAYCHYEASNGKEYDLLLISDLAGYNSLYDFPKDFGLATDIGNHPEQAQPGDVVVTFDRDTGESSTPV